MNPLQTERSRQGFTLIEAAAAVAITAAALGLAMGGFMFAMKNMNESDAQCELDIDVQLTMERLKKDLRLSSLDKIFYFPEGPGPYTAISFPMAEDNDGDGLFELDSDGRILWDKTVVYHIRPTTPNQLVVTTFDHRNNSLSDVQRQEQLNSVVEVGDGSDTYNGGNASSHVIFQNLLDWTIRPNQGSFDAYSPIVKRELVSLGFALISDGEHTFEFKVAGKNSQASGYKIGIDQLQVSPSYSDREAEAQLPASAHVGATPVFQYMESGSWKGNHQLYFPATAPGQSFTLTMENDRWEETNFGADGYEADNTVFEFDETLDPKDFVVRLEGNDVSWEASQQTYSEATASAGLGLAANTEVAIHINGSELLDNGGWIVYNGARCKLAFQAGAGPLKIKNVRIGKTPSLEDTDFSFAGPPVNVSFPNTLVAPGQTNVSDWVDLEINTTNNYLVEFTVADILGVPTGFPMAWPNQRTTVSDCLVDGMPTNVVLGLCFIAVSYPEEGIYTSQIFDTRLDSPNYGDVSWSAEMPSGTFLATKIRSGDQPDLSDASDWSAISASSVNPHSIGAAYKRYIQFQTLLQSSSDRLSTPKLKDLTIDWTGETRLVNVSGIFTKGPEYGIVEVLVDGMPLQSALSIDLMIYKDLFSFKGETKRVTSSLVADVRPRNTGK